ncbi:MAG TPA: DUF1810 domain-containing protein [Acetobacteraceae bacterium]
MADAYDLDRFVQAQEPVMAQVLAEMAAGRKRTHWMWFVFPQLAGLGHSAMARRYALGSLDEARAYLAHPVLGLRLVQCPGLVNGVEGRTINAIFGSPDDLKFHSCVTLFALVAPNEQVFGKALAKYFGGVLDLLTIQTIADR